MTDFGTSISELCRELSPTTPVVSVPRKKMIQSDSGWRLQTYEDMSESKQAAMTMVTVATEASSSFADFCELIADRIDPSMAVQLLPFGGSPSDTLRFALTT